jgi:PAS domain S-box-containing protein
VLDSPVVDAAPLDVSQLAVDRAHDLITLIDPEGRITFASPAWRSLGYEPAALVGTQLLELVHPDDVACAASVIAEVVGGAERDGAVARVRRADGTYATVESSGVMLRGADGAPLALLGTARDVTDREELQARLAELRAVNRLADAVARASTLDALLDEAVDAILDGVRASRASVLVKDAEGIMRFRAWRGLSDAYRNVTDGHSPWPRDAVDPEPVIVPDALVAGFERDLADTIRREGIRALAFIPLVHSGELLGKFMVYFDEPHELTESELRLCRSIANHLGSSTARFRARDQLRESLALLDSLFQNAPAGLAYWDTELRRVRANDAFTEIDAIPAEELGLHVHRVLERDEPAVGVLLEGAGRHFRASFYPVRDERGNRLGVGGVIEDVTPERLAQRAAQERAHAAEALEFIDDAVFLVDHERIVRVWNPAAAATLRVPDDDAIGRRIDDVVAGWAELDERRADGKAHILPLDVEGEEHWLAVSSVEFAGGTVYAVRDVTEEQRVDRVKSDFIATVSHELRTPLAAVYGAAVTLHRPDLQLSAVERDRFLEMIIAETDRLARIVNDILWASRVESPVLRIELEPVDLARLVEDVVAAARSYAPPSIALEACVDPALLEVRTDPDKLRQVLTNLLQNAVKYSPDGGRVRVSAAAAGDLVRIAVTDEGLGVPPAEQQRIWEKFVRLDPNLSLGVGGTGLGLYITRELVRRLGGTIDVESDGRRGSTFVVELPTS